MAEEIAVVSLREEEEERKKRNGQKKIEKERHAEFIRKGESCLAVRGKAASNSDI